MADKKLKLKGLVKTFTLVLPYFCNKQLSMDSAKKSTGLYWILFILSLVVLAATYAVAGGYASLVLPFNFTFFAKALDLM